MVAPDSDQDSTSARNERAGIIRHWPFSGYPNSPVAPVRTESLENAPNRRLHRRPNQRLPRRDGQLLSSTTVSPRGSSWPGPLALKSRRESATMGVAIRVNRQTIAESRSGWVGSIGGFWLTRCRFESNACVRHSLDCRRPFAWAIGRSQFPTALVAHARCRSPSG